MIVNRRTWGFKKGCGLEAAALIQKEYIAEKERGGYHDRSVSILERQKKLIWYHLNTNMPMSMHAQICGLSGLQDPPHLHFSINGVRLEMN